MSTLRKQTKTRYTHIANDLIDAEGMSYRAKGIAMVLLSKPDDWIIKIEYLMRVGKEGKKAIRVAMQELAEYGFLMRDRVLGPDNRITTVTYIADYPAYIDVGSVDRRIMGYEPAGKVITDLPLSDTSAEGTSQNRPVENGDMLVTPELITTDEVIDKRRKNSRAPKGKKTYNPDAYDF